MKQPPDLTNILKRKWVQINNRCGYQPAYKDIENRFSNFEEFMRHAIEEGFEDGYHVHRPIRDDHYHKSNVVFLPADEHRKITGREKRKLTDDQCREARQLYKTGTRTRSLARKYNLSQPAIWKLVTKQTYTDVEDN